MRAIGGLVIIIISIIFWILVHRGCDRVTDKVIDKGISLTENMLNNEKSNSKQISIDPNLAKSNHNKFYSDAKELYATLFLNQKEWKTVIDDHKIDSNVAANCSAKGLTLFFQSISKDKMNEIMNDKKYFIQTIGAPAIDCVMKQIK